MKKLIFLVSIVLSLMLVACEKEPVENQLRDEIEKYGEVTEITLYCYPEEFEEEPRITDGYVIGYEVLYQTETEADVEKIFALLEGWKAEENKVTDKFLLSPGKVYVCFHENRVVMSYATKVDDQYYGYIEGEAYYLPKELGAYIDELLKTDS